MRRVAAALAAALSGLAGVGGAQTPPDAAPETGAAAFARSDYAEAFRLWRGEAGRGSLDAKLQLGLLHDLGLGVPRDPAKAFRWYLEAAQGGHPDGQFNVGVMLDSGVGAPERASAASVWYTRAAANGHVRAQYNLGLMHAEGVGVPRNADIARYWLERAAPEIRAAAERLETLAPVPDDERALTSPVGLAGGRVALAGTVFAELAWTASPAPEGILFLVEVVRLPGSGETWGTPVLSETTAASGLSFELPDPAGAYGWRVLRVDDSARRYAAAPWQRLQDGDAALPDVRVTFRVSEGDAAARRLATEAADVFDPCCTWTQVGEEIAAPSASSVAYGFAEDRDLAAGLATFLPVLAPEDVSLSEGASAPGEVVVTLVGGPAS